MIDAGDISEHDFATAVVDAIRDGAYVLDADRVRVYANRRLREVTRFDDDLLYAEHPEGLVEAGYWSEEAGRTYREAAERVLDGTSAEERVEVTAEMRTDVDLTTETRLTPFEPDGEVTGVVGVVRDVSERANRQAELHRLNRRLERFSGFLSHDIRSPLTVASGHVELARQTGSVDDLDRAAAALDRIESLVSDVLSTTADADDLSLASVAVGSLARARLDSGDVDLGDGRLVVDADPVLADRELLARAIDNLLDNAAKHAGPAPTVRIATRDGRLVVADDGDGIAAEDRDAVREFGVSGAASTGIGLAIVEHVADRHGWTLRLESSDSGGLRVVFDGVESTP